MTYREQPYLPTVSFIGHSGSGKTTLIEKLIPELTSRGYRVTVAKHVGEEVDIDTPGKDTWRFSHAGAHKVIISMNQRTVVVGARLHQDTLVELQSMAGADSDLLIIEGHKFESGPKIEVRRDPASRPLAVRPELVAIVSAFPWADKVPCLQPSDIEGIGDLIEKRFLRPRTRRLALFIDGKLCHFDRPTASMLARATRTLVASAVRSPRPGQVELWLRLKN